MVSHVSQVCLKALVYPLWDRVLWKPQPGQMDGGCMKGIVPEEKTVLEQGRPC